MRIDAHTHIFPPEIVSSRERFFEGEPEFAALYDSPKARLAGAEQLIETMDRHEVDRAVTFGFPWRNRAFAERHNDYVMESAGKFPGRLVPLACVSPQSAWAVNEAERCLRAGARGLGELAIYGDFNPGRALALYAPLVSLCRERASVLLVHANEPVGHHYPGKARLGLEFFYELARSCAGLPLVLAHWGGGLCFFELLRREAPEVLSNVYYDTAASPFLYRSGIYRQVAAAAGVGKILFGSDYPLLGPKRYLDEIGESGLTEIEIAAVTGGNAARVFGPAE